MGIISYIYITSRLFYGLEVSVVWKGKHLQQLRLHPPAAPNPHHPPHHQHASL